MKERKPAKTTRTSATEGAAAPKRRRSPARKAALVPFLDLKLNPGQAQLMNEVLREFDYAEADEALVEEAPEVVEFLRYKLMLLAERQERLEALLGLES